MPLLDMMEIQREQKKYVQDNYDSDHCKEIEELLKFYQRKPTEDHDNDESVKSDCSKPGRRNFPTLTGQAKILFDEKAIYKLE